MLHWRNNLKGLTQLLWGLFFIAASSLTAESSRSPLTVNSIEIVGNKKIEKAAIRSRMSSQVGSAVSKELIREDIRAIFNLGYFEEIEVDEEARDNGMALIYRLKDKQCQTAGHSTQ